MPLKNKLKDFRAKFDINQHDFGKSVEVSRQTISLIECFLNMRGKKKVKIGI